MNSVDVLLALCKHRKIAVSKVERDLKYGNGYFKSLKKKEIPGNRLSEVADYFGVTMDYLLGATPESYLLGTEYQLKEAEKAYEKETDPDKREEIGGLIDLLRDSIADQRILALAVKEPATNNGNGRDESSDPKREEINRLLPLAPEWLQDQILALLKAEESGRTSQGGGPKDR